MEQDYQESDLPEIAKHIIEKALTVKNNEGATLITLRGDLGAGKTTLTQTIGKLLGIESAIQSPTYVIMKRYDIQNSAWKTLFHIDAYRLETSDDLQKLGWEKLLDKKDTLIILEWPEKVSALLKTVHGKIEIGHKDDTTRHISISWE